MDKTRGITINVCHVGYETASRSYRAFGLYQEQDQWCQSDGWAILLVAADDGPMSQTREHFLLARQVGVKKILVFINKADKADDEIVELVQLETSELLEQFGFPSGSQIGLEMGIPPHGGTQHTVAPGHFSQFRVHHREGEGGGGHRRTGWCAKDQALQLVGFGQTISTTVGGI